MKEHHLKTIPPYFQHVLEGIKTFEYRYNDRDYQEGDILNLHEFWDGEYTGRNLRVEVIYILKECFSLGDWVIMGFKRLEEPKQSNNVEHGSSMAQED